jgi:GDPmannose 4,6-dehydratase
MPRALVTGVGGQDGSLLAEQLLERRYEVVGTVRDLARDHENLAGIRDRIELVELELADAEAVAQAVSRLRPAEIYNLASSSLVPRSWERPVETAEAGIRGVTALLEAARTVDQSLRLFQASSSEIFGESRELPQTESTPVAPVSPYGAVKAYGHFLVGAYRRRYGLFACSGILFNHESPRRPREFVTRKVSSAAAAISLGFERNVRLGSLDARRDWGDAGDTVRAMRLMLQADEPDDYVVATGETHSVADLVTIAFEHVGLDWREHVLVDESLTRGRSEIWEQVGDAAKARARLGWKPEIGFAELVRSMVDADLERLRSGSRAR